MINYEAIYDMAHDLSYQGSDTTAADLERHRTGIAAVVAAAQAEAATSVSQVFDDLGIVKTAGIRYGMCVAILGEANAAMAPKEDSK